MKIHFRMPSVLLVWAILSTERLFTEFVFPDPAAPALKQHDYLVLGITIWITVRNLRFFQPGMRNWLALVCTALGLLAMESYGYWGNWFVYPHVFSKLLDLFAIFSVYAYYRKRGIPGLGLLIGWAPVAVLLNLAVCHPEALSLGSFLNHERGVDAEAAFLLILPLFYYLNRYLQHGSIPVLLAFFATAALIVFLQHRTVWVTAVVLMGVNLLLLRRTTSLRFTARRLLPMALIPFFVMSMGGLAVVLNDPSVLQKLGHNVDDIMNPETQGTGQWRYNQFEAYKPFLLEYPVAGMRLKGFELPVQFVDNESGKQLWSSGSGHHFHSFYVDRLFYFGWLGLLLFMLPPILLVIKRLLRPGALTPQAVTLLVASSGGLVYGMSYIWPYYYYAILGLMLAAIQVPVAAPAEAPATPPAPQPVPVAARPKATPRVLTPPALPSPVLHG